LLKAPNLVPEDLNIMEDRVKLFFSSDYLSEKKKNFRVLMQVGLIQG